MRIERQKRGAVCLCWAACLARLTLGWWKVPLHCAVVQAEAELLPGPQKWKMIAFVASYSGFGLLVYMGGYQNYGPLFGSPKY